MVTQNTDEDSFSQPCLRPGYRRDRPAGQVALVSAYAGQECWNRRKRAIDTLGHDIDCRSDPIRSDTARGMEIDRTGNVVWQFGEVRHPSNTIDHISSPGSIRHIGNGQRVAADTRNQRILRIDVDGANCEIMPHDGTLCDPLYADVLDNGNCLICDTGIARVIELDEQGYIVWHYGASVASRRLLSYPRSVEVTCSGGCLVADTAHDRIIENLMARSGKGLFTMSPVCSGTRCVRVLSFGSLLIADARNSRIVEVSATGRVLRQLLHFTF